MLFDKLSWMRYPSVALSGYCLPAEALAKEGGQAALSEHGLEVYKNIPRGLTRSRRLLNYTERR